jgi:hypothetical protein
MSQTLPERNEIYVTRQVERFFSSQGRHPFMLSKEHEKFLLLAGSLRLAVGQTEDKHPGDDTEGQS